MLKRHRQKGTRSDLLVLVPSADQLDRVAPAVQVLLRDGVQISVARGAFKNQMAESWPPDRLWLSESNIPVLDELQAQKRFNRGIQGTSVILFTSPYKWQNDSTNRALTGKPSVYCPYAYFTTDSFAGLVKQKQIRNADAICVESRWHQTEWERSQPGVAHKIHVTGFIGIWSALQRDKQRRTETDSVNAAEPSIGFAPHWTMLRNARGTSSLILLWRELELLLQNFPRLSVIYRPHPFLLPTLSQMDDKELLRMHTRFASRPRVVDAAQLAVEDFVVNVDLLLHNSGSFIAERAACGRPAIFFRDGVDFVLNSLSSRGAQMLGNPLPVADALAATRLSLVHGFRPSGSSEVKEFLRDESFAAPQKTARVVREFL